jgi:hypothetical protein
LPIHSSSNLAKMPHTNNWKPPPDRKGGKKPFKSSSGGKGTKNRSYKGRKAEINPHTNKPGRKLELKFDTKDRNSYLTGFSQRKKERRAFGLAMQKVKDRKGELFGTDLGLISGELWDT